MKRIAIAGAGIGGLTTAIALKQAGFDVHVFEAAPEIKPLGAGITLAANAIKAFEHLGIADEIRNISQAFDNGLILSHKGKRVSSISIEGVNSYAVHRAALHDSLMRLAGAGCLHTGKKVSRFSTDENEVNITFEDGSVFTCDALIASDGIHSAVRQQLDPGAEERYAGYTCWRAVIHVDDELHKQLTTSETWGPAGRFGIVPLRDNKVYWFAVISTNEARDPDYLNYKVADLKQRFSSYHKEVPQMLSLTQDHQLIHSDIIDLKPIKKYAFGNVLLLGDAAHATTPNMGQGACMAIEDAAVLKGCMIQHTQLSEAFAAFERKRIKRTQQIVNQSWTLGKIAQLSNPFVGAIRNALMSGIPKRMQEQQLKAVFDISF